MMTNLVQLRLAERGDFDAIRNLVYDLDEIDYEAAKTRLKPPYRSELTEARYAAWLADRQTRLVVALLKNGIVGFSRVDVQEKAETRTEPARIVLKIHNIIIRATERRRGIGALLFEDIKALSRHFDIDGIELALAHSNEGAARFFEAQGLKPLARVMGCDRGT